jgi:hypothetical protein
MPHDTELDRLRDNEHREEMALQRAERALEVDARQLAHRLDDLRLHQRSAACELAAAYRHEHFGQDPPPRISARATRARARRRAGEPAGGR